ncbi:MAG: OOP family OmpA-OmpF porin, partial [Myxococcota bacterium]
TDNSGDREYNVDLAERRAWSVMSYLVEQGVKRARLFAKGFGSTRALDTNRTKIGRAKNRRVEFHLIKPGEKPEGDLDDTQGGSK